MSKEVFSPGLVCTKNLEGMDFQMNILYKLKTVKIFSSMINFPLTSSFCCCARVTASPVHSGSCIVLLHVHAVLDRWAWTNKCKVL